MKNSTTDDTLETLTRIRVLADGTRVQVLSDGTTIPYHEKSQTDWASLDSMSEHNIDTSELPELDEQFWESAKVVPSRRKRSTTIRLDADMLDWFKSQGKGWQTQINRILQAYYKAHNN